MRRQSLTEKAYREIRSRITKHIIKPGTLITTKELAESLSMSQTPIREALCILEHEYFVQRLPKRGYAVRFMNVSEFIDIYDVRIAIESLAVELATEKIGNEALTKLEKIVGSGDAGEDIPKTNIMEIEQEFHFIILEATKNSLLEQTGKRILDRIWMVQKIVLHNSEHWLESANDHQEIFAKIKAGQGKQASRIMQKHLQWGRKLVLTRLEDGDDFLSTFFHDQ